MKKQSKKNSVYPALTLMETVISLAIMAVIFAVLLPQIRSIQNSWDSNASNTETLQNGRILIDHMSRNLSKAVKITAVSDSSETSGYIEFEDSAANVLKYAVDAENYVEFGPVGSLSDLAGPVSQFQFTCSDACDLDTPITDVAAIRSVKIETMFTNAGTGQDKSFTTRAYLRTNNQDDDPDTDFFRISKASDPWFEFDADNGASPALSQIDSTHYLCAYQGNLNNGWAVVLMVDTVSGNTSSGTPFKFDAYNGASPALSQIDGTHYLCAYQGESDDGWAVVLTVDTVSWDISKETPFEFDTNNGATPALSQIDSTHYLCAYQGEADDGWAVVLEVDTGSWNVSKETAFEFDTNKGIAPALSQINSTHYLCAYRGDADDGWAVVLEVDTGSWNISKETPFEFDTKKCESPALSQIDSTHYLCAYQGDADDGWAAVLSVNTGSWNISKGTSFEFDTNKGASPALSQIDSTHYLCAYQGDADDGWAVVLTVDTGSWDVSQETPFEFDTNNGVSPALSQIDSRHYLCAYQGDAGDGWAGILKLMPPLLP